ncbi:DUF3263 domain-containing protein [Micromonospora sp. NPDC050980]|uniref:DUF3263 domain-containing protein n=1 Tax=Micromonospora sp. NPDC050980 TaxID=3155161 RepID=UPI0033DF0261
MSADATDRAAVDESGRTRGTRRAAGPSVPPPRPAPPVESAPPAGPAPAVSSPVAEPPLAEPPLAEPPLAEPPLAEPPLAEPPLAEPPLAEPPLAEPPLAEPPLAEASSVDEARPEAAGAEPAGGLTERERRILDFESQWWKHAGAKEQAIRDTFGLSATRYYQLLNALLDRPAALAAEPLLVGRLRRLRSSRARNRRR